MKKFSKRGSTCPFDVKDSIFSPLPCKGSLYCNTAMNICKIREAVAQSGNDKEDQRHRYPRRLRMLSPGFIA